MGVAFWVKRFVLVYLIALVTIGAAQWLRGHSVEVAVEHAVIWAAVSAVVFTSARLYQARRGRHCALCADTPEMAEYQAAHRDRRV